MTDQSLRSFVYAADAGSLKIGTDDGWTHVSNGVGDGSFDLSIGDDEFSGDFITDVGGSRFAVFGYDCGDQKLVWLSGRWGLYRDARGNMNLEPWDGDSKVLEVVAEAPSF